MPRAAKHDISPVKDKTLVIDNGGYTIKAGFASANPNVSECHVIPNCIVRDSDRRVWIGSQLEQCKDFRELVYRRPVDKGYLVNWESEKTIWGQSFFSQNAELKVEHSQFT
jgi:actin-related protein 6